MKNIVIITFVVVLRKLVVATNSNITFMKERGSQYSLDSRQHLNITHNTSK